MKTDATVLSPKGLRPLDWSVLAYAALSSGVALARMHLVPGLGWLALGNLLVVPLVLLLRRPGLGRFGRGFAEVYPLVLVVIFYGALDSLAGHGAIPTHEKAIQHWDQLLFGSQVSHTWWQNHPSRFWSTVLHAVYASYYLVVASGVIWFLARGELRSLRRAVGAIWATYGICFVIFMLYPVAGPNYEFPRPSAEFLSNPPARFVYALLQRGSSYGAAFPSSHVAAALVAAFVTWMGARKLGLLLAVPALLLIVAVVYCQMHYAADSLAAVALAAVVIGGVLVLERRQRSTVSRKPDRRSQAGTAPDRL